MAIGGIMERVMVQGSILGPGHNAGKDGSGQTQQ